MDTQDSLVLEPSAEVRLDVRLEGHMRITDQSKTQEVREIMSSEGKTSNKASQDDRTPTEAMPKVEVIEMYRPLLQAAMRGDWKDHKDILKKDPKEMTDNVMTIGNMSVTELEFAVMAAEDQYSSVLNLVKSSVPIYQESIFRSALYDAARRGSIIMVKGLLKGLEKDLVKEVFAPNMVPDALSYAVSNAPMQKKVIWHLARQIKSAPDFKTMSCLILAGHMDVALFLAGKYPKGVTIKDNSKRSLLGDLAKMKSYFRSGDRLNFLEKLIYECIPLCLIETSFDNPNDATMMTPALKQFKTSLWNLATKLAPYIKRIGESKSRHKCSLEFANLALTEKKKYMKSPEILEFLLTSGIVLDSASQGTHEIVELCLNHFPELMWYESFPKDLMKEVVNGRQVELFRLVNGYNRILKLSDDIFTNHELMEAVVRWSPGCVPADVPGAAFLLQRELHWFKVLEDRSDPTFKTTKFKVPRDWGNPSFKSLKLEETKQRGGRTYWEVFVEQRKDLLKEAGQWMKDTSSSCSLIATLIITVAFTAAFTIPGGNDNSTGNPIFLKNDSFMVFAFADALALFSSVTATVMFLAIVTPCYTVEDILHSLPRKMIMGITCLFLSLGFMLVAFTFALTIVLNERSKWICIPIYLLATVPVCFFLFIQFPLYVKMVNSIYRPRLYHPWKLRSNPWKYDQKQKKCN